MQTSRSDMGLTNRKLQNPHYFEVINEFGVRVRTTGKETDAIRVCEIHPTWSYRIVFPPIPLTVDVPSVTIKECELPEQKILPESNAQKLDL